MKSDRWLVISDTWLDGRPLLWGTIVELEPEKAAALRRAGRVVFLDAVTYRAFAQHVRGLLTPREAQIVELTATMAGDKQIAERLGIGVGTVRTHWQRIFTKLHRPGRTSASLFWMAYTLSGTSGPVRSQRR
jgi:DNA-binding CsgD family transcriptional regulator